MAGTILVIYRMTQQQLRHTAAGRRPPAAGRRPPAAGRSANERAFAERTTTLLSSRADGDVANLFVLIVWYYSR